MAIDPRMFKAAREALQKAAFTPMGPQGATQPPPPPQGGGPGMDPSGGAGGPPPEMGPEGAPQGGGEAVTVQLQDLVQLFQMVAGGGAPPDAGGGAPPAPGGAPAPAPGGAPASGGAAPAPGGAPAEGGAAPKGKGGKGNDIAMLNDKIDNLANAVNQMVAFFTGVQSATGGGAEGGAAPGGQEDIGMSAPPSMGGGVDASQGPPTPMMPGMPPGAMPGTDGGAMGGAMGGPPGGPAGGGGAPPPMQVQASDRSNRDPRILNRILVNLRK